MARCVHKRKYDPVIQEKLEAQRLIPVTQHEENRYDNVVYIDKQTCHEDRVEDLVPLESESGKYICRRKRNHKDKRQRKNCNKYRIQQILSHLSILERHLKVLHKELFRESPWVGTGSDELRVPLKACHKYPRHRYNDRNRKYNESYIDNHFANNAARFLIFIHIFRPPFYIS